MLYALVKHGEDVITMEDLVDKVVSLETARCGPGPPSVDDVAISLRHVHLPKLTDCGFVEYDARSDTLRFWGDDTVTRFLELAYDREFP